MKTDVEIVVDGIRAARDGLRACITAARVNPVKQGPGAPFPGDPRAWALALTKLDEALMWAERAAS